jgi:hypothetical protein
LKKNVKERRILKRRGNERRGEGENEGRGGGGSGGGGRADYREVETH